MRHVTLLAVLFACGRPAPPPGADPDTDVPDTDTDVADTDVADTDTDVADTDVADTDDTDTDVADSDTADTGIAPVTGRVPGCAPAWVEPAVDLADCSAATLHASGGYNSSSQTERFDAAGRLVYRNWWEFSYYISLVDSWTYDAVTGDVATYAYDEDDGYYTEDWTYTWTYDGLGRPVGRTDVETLGGYFSGVYTYDWAWTYGPCGVDTKELLQLVPQLTTYEHFVDGVRESVDSGADGTVDTVRETYVDPVTGALLVEELDIAVATPGPEYVYTYAYNPATGHLAEKAGSGLDYDYLWTWTRDAEGRVLVLDFESVKKKGGKITTWTETTTWTCPP